MEDGEWRKTVCSAGVPPARFSHAIGQQYGSESEVKNAHARFRSHIVDSLQSFARPARRRRYKAIPKIFAGKTTI